MLLWKVYHNATMDRVQSVVSAAARITADARRYDHATSEGPTLGAATSPVQVVCTRTSLTERRSADIHDWSDVSVCQQHCQSSFALGVICQPCRHRPHVAQPSATSVRRRWSGSLEQSTGCSSFALASTLHNIFKNIWYYFCLDKVFLSVTTCILTMLVLL